MPLRAVPLLLAAAALAAAQTPNIPDTPAGHTLQAWFDAFNSGDRARIQAYLARFDPARPLDGMMNFRQQTGGFDLLGIDANDRTHIEFRVKEKGGTTTAIGKMEVKDADPATVVNFGVRAIPPGMTAADMHLKMDAAMRDRVIEGAVKNLNEYYVYPDVAKKMEEAIRARQKRGEYDSVVDGETFARMLTEHLRDVSHDRHLGVNFSAAPMPPPRSGPDPDAEARMRANLERSNCAFEKVEWLRPNIGYLKFNGFASPSICGPTASAAMNFLGSVDALIIDLRENGGGDPRMVAYISSYLFNERTHLNDLYNRKEDHTEEFWTQPDVPGKKLGGKPVFLLTSKRTFSGAEEFSYNLKNLKRATIIGETTGGGAHPVSGHRIDDHFSIGVPFARAINPISKTNWEGTGVEPDVKASADEALDVAKKMAAEAIKKPQ
jgi:hypothetical protein